MEQLRLASAKDMEQLRKDNAKDIEGVETKISTLRDSIKTNRWIFGLALLSLLPLMIYLHSDIRNEQKQMRAKIDKLEERVGSLEAKMDRQFARLEQLILSLHGEGSSKAPLKQLRQIR